MASDSSAAARAIDAVCRIESPRVIARVARMVRDVGLAEELAQDAFVAALEQWPESGIPDNPGAWLTSVAKRRAVDRIRRERIFAAKEESIGYEAESLRPPSEPALKGYHFLPAARGDLLARSGRWAEARAEFERAESLARNDQERRMLADRAAACAAGALWWKGGPRPV